MKKLAFCICENKDADQLCGNHLAYQGVYFSYMVSTIPLLPTSEILGLKSSSVVVQPSFFGPGGKP